MNFEIGISTATFWRKAVTEDAFALIEECGADICEVFLTTYSEYTKEFRELLTGRKGKIRVHSVHTLNSQFEPQLYSPAERTASDAVRIFRSVAATGEALGAKCYTFHGPARMKKKPYEFDYEKLGRVTGGLCDILSEYGMELSFENVHWTYYNFPGFFGRLREFCPNLRATLDIKQAYQSGISWKEFLKDMGGAVSTVHVCDVADDGRLCPIGQGTFDFKELFAMLSDSGIHAPIIIELYSGDYKSFSEVKNSVDYLKSL